MGSWRGEWNTWNRFRWFLDSIIQWNSFQSLVWSGCCFAYIDGPQTNSFKGQIPLSHPTRSSDEWVNPSAAVAPSQVGTETCPHHHHCSGPRTSHVAWVRGNIIYDLPTYQINVDYWNCGAWTETGINSLALDVRHGKGSSWEATRGIQWRLWETFKQAIWLPW